MRTAAMAGALFLALAPVAGARAQRPAPADSIAAYLDSLRHDPHGVALPRADVRQGATVVPAGTTVAGSIAAWHGDLDVRGEVDGDAVAVGGDVLLHPGAVVRGDAVSVGGTVRADGGTVGGEMRTLSALTVGALPLRPRRTPAQAARRSMSLAVGWYLVLAVIGFGVALFARPKLETIAERIRDDFSRSFLFGLLGQIAILPGLVITIIALAITIIGALLIPFAIVAFVLAVDGALALGFIATSFVTGDAIVRRRGPTLPGGAPVMQYLLIGLSLYLLLWVVSGAFAWVGILGGVLRLVAGAITWAAVTVGFGATLASRGGTRSFVARAPEAVPPPAEDYSWQTPTPVSGVAAARRPTPPPRAGEP